MISTAKPEIVNLKSKISGEDNPSYLAISRDGKHVFAVNEVRDSGDKLISL